MTSRQDRTARYLDDLSRMLSGGEPSERAEVLDAVREHIDTSIADLGHAPSETELDRILGELGTPGAVAAEALAGQPFPDQAPMAPAGPGAAVMYAPPPPPVLTRTWVPAVAVLLIAVGAIFGILVLPLGLLLAGIIMVCASPLWTPLEKVLGALIAPLCIVPAPFWGLLAFRVSSGEEAALNAWAVIIPALLIAGLAILVLLWVRGSRRAAELDRLRHGNQA